MTTRQLRYNKNKCLLGGNLTKDPEFKELAGGTTVCNAVVALNESFPDKSKPGSFKDETTFVPITAWGKLAERLANCSKGDNLDLECKLRTEEWETDGQKRQRLRAIVLAFRNLTGRTNSKDSDASEDYEDDDNPLLG